MSVELEYPLSDTDRMAEWAGNISCNPDARIAHDLAMVGHDESLAFQRGGTGAPLRGLGSVGGSAKLALRIASKARSRTRVREPSGDSENT